MKYFRMITCIPDNTELYATCLLSTYVEVAEETPFCDRRMQTVVPREHAKACTRYFRDSDGVCPTSVGQSSVSQAPRRYQRAKDERQCRTGDTDCTEQPIRHANERALRMQGRDLVN